MFRILTPIEAYRSLMNNINSLYDSRIIDDEEYFKLSEKISEQFKGQKGNKEFTLPPI